MRVTGTFNSPHGEKSEPTWLALTGDVEDSIGRETPEKGKMATVSKISQLRGKFPKQRDAKIIHGREPKGERTSHQNKKKKKTTTKKKKKNTTTQKPQKKKPQQKNTNPNTRWGMVLSDNRGSKWVGAHGIRRGYRDGGLRKEKERRGE